MRCARIAVPAAFILALAGCGDRPTVVPDVPLVDEEALTRDVALSAADAFSYLIDNLRGHEEWVSRGPPYAVHATTDRSWIVGRINECYDAAGARVSMCLPFASVRMFVTDGFMDGTRRSPSTSTVSWAGVLHHVINDTTARIFTGGTETARVHNGFESSHDTTVFVDSLHRRLAETTVDSVKGLTFQLPHAPRALPVSGSIVRRVVGRVEITREGTSVTHDFTRRIEVTFPADADGSVVATIDGKACRLRLREFVPTGCQ